MHNISDCSHGFIHLHGMYNQKQMSLSVMYLSIQQLWLLLYSRYLCNIVSREHSCWTSRRHNCEILEFENHFCILTSVSRSFERLLIPVETKNGVTFRPETRKSQRNSNDLLNDVQWNMPPPSRWGFLNVTDPELCPAFPVDQPNSERKIIGTHVQVPRFSNVMGSTRLLEDKCPIIAIYTQYPKLFCCIQANKCTFDW